LPAVDDHAGVDLAAYGRVGADEVLAASVDVLLAVGEPGAGLLQRGDQGGHVTRPPRIVVVEIGDVVAFGQVDAVEPGVMPPLGGRGMLRELVIPRGGCVNAALER